MRYLVLVLILLAANRFLPVVTLDDGNDSAQVINSVAPLVIDTVVLPGHPETELLDLEFAQFEPPPELSLHSMPDFGTQDVVPVIITVTAGTTQAIIGRNSSDAVVAWEAEQGLGSSGVARIDEAPSLAPAAPDAEASRLEFADTENIREVTVGALNIRSGPSSRTRVVGTLKNGARLVVTGERKGGWVEVATDEEEGTGWVFSRYLEPVEDV